MEINIAEAAATVAKNRYSAFRFKASGGMSSLSPNVKPGDKLEEIHGKVECAGMKLTIDYTERVVLRKETVKVPAGTFDCIVIQERKVEKAPLIKRDNITTIKKRQYNSISFNIKRIHFHKIIYFSE